MVHEVLRKLASSNVVLGWKRWTKQSAAEWAIHSAEKVRPAIIEVGREMHPPVLMMWRVGCECLAQRATSLATFTCDRASRR